MKVQYPLFSQVALAQDLPEYNLKRGNVAITRLSRFSLAKRRV